MAEFVTLAALGWLLYRHGPSSSLRDTTTGYEPFEVTNRFLVASGDQTLTEEEAQEEYDDENPLSPSETAAQLCKIKGKGACLIKTEDGNMVADLPDAIAAARVINEMKRRMGLIIDYIGRMVQAYDVWAAEKEQSEIDHSARMWAKAWFIKIKDCKELMDQIKVFKRFLKRYPDITMSEKTVIKASHLTSYLIEKKEMALCMRRDQNGALYDNNTVMYVTIHEFAHAMSESSGHGQEFIYNFQMLLRVAIGLSQYIQVDYSVYPINYCGLQLDGAVLV